MLVRARSRLGFVVAVSSMGGLILNVSLPLIQGQSRVTLCLRPCSVCTSHNCPGLGLLPVQVRPGTLIFCSSLARGGGNLSNCRRHPRLWPPILCV